MDAVILGKDIRSTRGEKELETDCARVKSLGERIRSFRLSGKVARAAEALRLGLLTVLAFATLTGAYAGIIYWAVKGWIWGVILSAFVPFFGAASMVLSLLE